MVVENYPQLKANEQFNRLTDELSGTENRIAVERMRYNEKVQDYNTLRRKFPSNITATLFGFKEYQLFQVAGRGEAGAEGGLRKVEAAGNRPSARYPDVAPRSTTAPSRVREQELGFRQLINHRLAGPAIDPPQALGLRHGELQSRHLEELGAHAANRVRQHEHCIHRRLSFSPAAFSAGAANRPRHTGGKPACVPAQSRGGFATAS